MKKIAPTLQRFFPVPAGWKPTSDFLAARAELRALLAVARAAKNHACGLKPVNGYCGCGLCDRLARLDGVSGRKGGK